MHSCKVCSVGFPLFFCLCKRILCHFLYVGSQKVGCISLAIHHSPCVFMNIPWPCSLFKRTCPQLMFLSVYLHFLPKVSFSHFLLFEEEKQSVKSLLIWPCLWKSIQQRLTHVILPVYRNRFYCVFAMILTQNLNTWSNMVSRAVIIIKFLIVPLVRFIEWW